MLRPIKNIILKLVFIMPDDLNDSNYKTNKIGIIAMENMENTTTLGIIKNNNKNKHLNIC
jgi:hypothetical protein